MTTSSLKHSVETYRAAGLEAKWAKRNGTPFIYLRNPKAKHAFQRETWWLCDRSMFESMQNAGIVEGFSNHTLLGDVFFV
jgi:hypothetical protein